MREVSIQIPRDVLRSLFEGKQSNVPFTVTGEGEPLRIVIWAVQPKPKPKKFGGF